MDAPIDDVWSTLTETTRLARWYGEVEGELRPGGEYASSPVDGRQIDRLVARSSAAGFDACGFGGAEPADYQSAAKASRNRGAYSALGRVRFAARKRAYGW